MSRAPPKWYPTPAITSTPVVLVIQKSPLNILFITSYRSNIGRSNDCRNSHQRAFTTIIPREGAPCFCPRKSWQGHRARLLRGVLVLREASLIGVREQVSGVGPSVEREDMERRSCPTPLSSPSPRRGRSSKTKDLSLILYINIAHCMPPDSMWPTEFCFKVFCSPGLLLKQAELDSCTYTSTYYVHTIIFK